MRAWTGRRSRHRPKKIDRTPNTWANLDDKEPVEFLWPFICASFLIGFAPPEGWAQWMSTPVNWIGVLAPIAGTAAASVWATKLHRHSLGTIRELRGQVASLQAEKEASEASNAAKDMFLVKLSHEIRTPMNGIIGFAESASRGEMTLEQRRQLDSVLYSAEWLTQVVADVLDFTRMQAANVKLDAKEFAPTDVALSSVKIMEPRALEKNLTIGHRVDPEVPPLCIGDPSRLRQIVVNLLDNAVRFTSTGGVILTVGVAERIDKDYLLSFAVADTGIGIPADRQQTIFEPFQASRGDGKKVGGAGLGLSICRQLTQLMGGTIEVQSQIGAGSTFRFTARVAVPARPDQPVGLIPARRSARRLSILLAEADAASRRTNTKLLESAGHQVTPASRALEAVEKFSTDLFDLILIDADVSDMEAVRPCQQFREFEPDVTHTPVYLLIRDDMKPGSEADGYIRKPLDTDELLAVVGRVASPERSGEVPRG